MFFFFLYSQKQVFENRNRKRLPNITWVFMLTTFLLNQTNKFFISLQKMCYLLFYLIRTYSLFFSTKQISFLSPHFSILPTKLKWEKTKVMLGNNFCFLFSKTCFGEYKEKTIFLYFWNKKHVWLVEIKKIVFWKKNRKY